MIIITTIPDVQRRLSQVESRLAELHREQMLQMMARENLEEWGTSAWIEMETIRAVIDAYGKGEVELPKVPRDTPSPHIKAVPRLTGERPYTKATVAQFLGWTKKGGKEPDSKCETAFKALDMIDDKRKQFERSAWRS